MQRADDVEDLLDRTRASQGFPPTITDPAALRIVAALLLTRRRDNTTTSAARHHRKRSDAA